MKSTRMVGHVGYSIRATSGAGAEGAICKGEERVLVLREAAGEARAGQRCWWRRAVGVLKVRVRLKLRVLALLGGWREIAWSRGLASEVAADWPRPTVSTNTKLDSTAVQSSMTWSRRVQLATVGLQSSDCAADSQQSRQVPRSRHACVLCACVAL